MRIIGIRDYDIKEVHETSDYGFEIVTLANGAKVVVNTNPIVVKGKGTTYNMPTRINYPRLEYYIGQEGEMKLAEDKIKSYIASLLIDTETDPKRYYDERFAATNALGFEIETEDADLLPQEVFENHPDLIGEIDTVSEELCKARREFAHQNGGNGAEEMSREAGMTRFAEQSNLQEIAEKHGIKIKG